MPYLDNVRITAEFTESAEDIERRYDLLSPSQAEPILLPTDMLVKSYQYITFQNNNLHIHETFSANSAFSAVNEM